MTRPLSVLTDLLYPPACLLCQARCVRDAVLCGACLASCRRPEGPGCLRCGIPLQAAFDAQMACRSCRAGPPGFEAARAPWLYTGTIRAVIQQFKYRQHWRLGRWLADAMAELGRRQLPVEEIDAVLAVPMHWMKRRFRGDDPSAALARHLAGRFGKPFLRGALAKTRWTQTQTQLRGCDRFLNVRGAYRAPPSRPLGRLLLVDDVLTSGATADACARALTGAGAEAVYVLAAARTPSPSRSPFPVPRSPC